MTDEWMKGKTESIAYVDPIHKWLIINSSFVSIKVFLTNLVFKLINQKNFYSQTRLVELTYDLLKTPLT